jgi:hypothetical protein
LTQTTVLEPEVVSPKGAVKADGEPAPRRGVSQGGSNGGSMDTCQTGVTHGCATLR